MDEKAIIDEAREMSKSTLAQVHIRVMGERSALTKRSIVGEPDESSRSNQASTDEQANAFTTLGALDPVYDPEMLALLFEHSNSLRQNVDSYATNIDGFGHRFEPLFDLNAQDIDQRIGDAIFTDRERALAEAEEPRDAEYPTAEEIKAEKDKIARTMRIERTKAHHFFEFCSPDTSFVTLRKRTRQDIEVMANAYWEVIRNLGGQVVQFVYIPGFTMRLLPLDRQVLNLKCKVRVSELSFDELTFPTRMRRYVQVVEGRTVFFKEFGDPRLISSTNGETYPDLDAMKLADPSAVPANELIHFKIHSSRSPYGVPRWIGNLLSVIGSRQAEEVNFNYFENKSVPPMAILVSGGRMTEQSVTRLENHVEANLKGKRNFHKIMIIEADGPESKTDARDANASRMKIDLKPLTGAQHNDALFQNYDERNIDKVGQSFRLPRMLRGDIRDFNKATADAALTFAEMQVFEPERQDFDFIVNRKILSALGIRFWKFVSLAPIMRDPSAMSEVIKNLSNANVMIPAEARELMGDVFNRAFRPIRAPWTQQPAAFTLAGLPLQEEAAPFAGAPVSPEADNFGPSGGEDATERPEAEGIEARLIPKHVQKRIKKEIARGAADALVVLRDELRRHEADVYKQALAEAHGASS